MPVNYSQTQGIQFPQVQPLDLGAPLQTYYGRQQQLQQQQLQQQKLQLEGMKTMSELQMNNLKLQEYYDQMPQKDLQRKMEAVKNDETLMKWGKESLGSLDTTAPDFDQKAIQTVVDLQKKLVIDYGFTPAQSDRVASMLIKSGGITRDAVRKMQEDNGILPKPENKIENGQLVTIRGNQATAAPIAGFVKKPEAESTLGKLIIERNRFAPGTPEYALYTQGIEKEVTKSGQTIRFNPDGSMELIQGAAGGSPNGLGQAASGKVETKMLDASNALARLNGIKASLNDNTNEYLTVQGKAKMAAIDAKLSVGMNASPEEQQYVKQSTIFATRALSNLNTTLNELSGAAVTETEAKRIRQTLPDPGSEGVTKIFSGDNSLKFQTKLDDGINMMKMSIARLAYIDANGFSVSKNKKGDITGFFDNNGKSINLEDMPDIMKNRANEIAQNIKAQNQNIDQTQLSSMVQQAVAQEFGLVAGAPQKQQQSTMIVPSQMDGETVMPYRGRPVQTQEIQQPAPLDLGSIYAGRQ